MIEGQVMKEKAIWLLSLVIGGSFAMSTLLHASGYGRFDVAVFVVFVFLSIGFTALVRRFLVPRLLSTGLSARATVVVALIALVTAGCLYYLAPFRTLYFPRTFELEVTATGAKGAADGGSEVWARVERKDGKPLAPEKNRTEEGWEVRDGGTYIASARTTVRWMVRADKDFRLVLVQHPWSGLAEVRYQGTVRKVNLYAAAGAEPLVIELSVQPPPRKRDIVLRWFGVAADVVVMSLLFFVLLARAVRGRPVANAEV